MVNKVAAASGAARATTTAVVGATGGAKAGRRGGTAHPRPESMTTVGLHHGWARGGEEVERGISNGKWRFGMKMGRWRFI